MVLPRLSRSGGAALLGVMAAMPMTVALWGFTVDDALIIARYATNIASGAGYRFNPSGPATDGVTPLGWAVAMAPFAGAGPLAALRAAKLLGLAAWLLTALLLGRAVGQSGVKRRRYAALLLVLCSAPLGAWSVAGMETGFVLALATLAAVACCFGRDRAAAAAAGVAAALRPECLPWAIAVALASRPARGSAGGEGRQRSAAAADSGWRKLRRLCWAVGPFASVAAIRLVVFGRVAPLALYAKPSDLAHGWRYSVACFLLTGPIAAIAWRRLDPWCRGLQIATLVHFVAVALAGGDWMPLSRLVVPVLPGVVLIAAHALDRSRWWVGLPRLALGAGGLLFALARAGPAAARVLPDRLALIRELAPTLQPARVVAALDIGWVGAATDAAVVDLAGITDPAVAALPGGHTSKQIPPALLASREVDTIVLLLAPGQASARPWTQSRFARRVEHDLAALPAMADQFRVIAMSRHPRLPYVVVRRR